MGKSLVTGIEIGHHSIKAVVLKPNKGTFALVDYQELPIEAGIFSDNHMSNYQKIVKKLKELRKSLPRFSTKVALAIPDNAVISKVLQIDSGLNDNEIEYAISDAFSHQTPFPIDDLYLDYVPLTTDGQSSPTHYQVYATKKELVDPRVEVFRSASFQPVVVDLRAHALVHIWQLAARQQVKTDWLLIDVGVDHASLCMDLVDKAPFCKEIVLATHEKEADSNLCLSLAQSREEFSAELLDKIQRNLQLIVSMHGKSVKGVWLSGVGAAMPVLANEISTRLAIECELLNPLTLFSTTSQQPSANLLANGHRFTSAAGIALRALTWLESRYAA
ncbi:type IV pilus assembly protein PilM [Vibrio europaeus]|uniref:type IV pilus assembly protein PilM n=1 Tax=Vibrio europaeus TaxID=300876 RepID=UPI002340646C|nr:type IV pilus assembly protein PilM [Vibrio europaeus]MDC5849227.1 type IV pilus assembly protein PilM [Vibrio europaeus]